MALTSIGDLAQSLVLRSRSADLKQSISRLTDELSSKQVSDVTARLGGDYSYLTDIDHTLARLDGYRTAAAEAATFAEAAQISLERLQTLGGTLSVTLITAGSGAVTTVRDHASQVARDQLDMAVKALNDGVAGRSLFGGTATDGPPLGAADDLIDALRPQLAGLTTSSDVMQAAQDWFDDPAGFRATFYLGADENLAPISVGAGQQVNFSLRADYAEFRNLLRNASVAALIADTTLGFDRETRSELLKATGEGLLSAQGAMSGLRADLGFAEARIEDATTRNSAARSSLEYARGKLLGADPFDTATRLNDVQFQLESLYSVTVRTSRLSLVNFLR